MSADASSERAISRDQADVSDASSRSFSRTAWGVLAYTIAVVLWGAYVRATGSGAGCGAHWPMCNGEVLPRSPSVETMIELTHRITSGLSLVAILALARWAFRAFPPGHRVRAAAAGSVVFILTEALLGAGLVLFGLVEDDASPARAVTLAVHLSNTFVLLACLALSAAWANDARAAGTRSPFAPGSWNALGACLVVGVSGAIAALGDTLFPAASLAEAFRQDLSATAHVLVRLRLLHPWIAVIVAIGLVLWATRLRRADPGLGGLAGLLSAIVVVQLVAGAANVLLLVPVWLQLVHLLLADLLWIAVVLLGARAADAALGTGTAQTDRVLRNSSTAIST